MKILFCPTINADRICKECPTGINHLATFVVDLNKLRHPDDIKKDEFGKWNYSGSHCVLYSTWKDGKDFQFKRVDSHNSNQESNKNIVQLRRVRCTHPSNQVCLFLLLVSCLRLNILLRCRALIMGEVMKFLVRLWVRVIRCYFLYVKYHCSIDSNGDPHHLCLLSYRIPSGFQPVVTPHGNSKSSIPFYPTFPSTKKQIAKQKVQKMFYV